MSDPLPTEAEPPIEPATLHVAAPQTMEPPPRPPSRGGTSLFLTMFLFVVTAGGLVLAWSYPKPAEGVLGIESLGGEVHTLSQKQTEMSDLLESETQAVAQQIQLLQARLDKLQKDASQREPAQTAARPPVDESEISHRLDDLSARLDALASRPVPPPVAAPVPAPVPGASDQQLADLTAKVDQFQAAQKTALDQIAAQQKDTLDTVGGRIGKLEQSAGRVESEADRAARLLRVQEATAALQEGMPLGVLPDSPPALARFATAPPPLEAGLRASFPAIAEQARAASRPEQAKTSLLDRAWARVEQNVTVRRGDQVIVGDPAAGVLSRAEDDVRNGDLANAVQALHDLHGPAEAAVRDWVGQAQSLVEARVALISYAARK